MIEIPLASAEPAGTLTRALGWFRRYRFLLAALSLVAGLASYFLIQRQDWVAKPIALILLFSWLVILLERPLTRGRLPAGVLRFLIQSVHQETFFFALPFFYATTNWTTPQAGVTLLFSALALCTVWDPLYFGVIAARRWLYLIFHALAIFVTMLVALPIVVHLTTGQSLALASVAMVLLVLPGLVQAMGRVAPLQRVALLAGAAALGALAWYARAWVPPATLRVNQAMVTDRVDVASRTPGVQLVSVPAAHLHSDGLYAWTAIRAPLGLNEKVFHRWMLNGVEVDRIAMKIAGGRAEGYRAWSHKKGFPADPRGEWRVQVMTEGGQLIGFTDFTVLGDVPTAAPAAVPLLLAPPQVEDLEAPEAPEE